MDRTTINGVEVVARQVAQLPTPPNNELKDCTGIEVCLLVDGTTLYQCASAHAECDYASDNPYSVRSHLRSHGPKSEVRRLTAEKAAAEKKRLEVERELAERKERQSNGGKRAAATRRANRTAVKSSSSPAPTLSTDEQLEAIAALIETTTLNLNAIVIDTVETLDSALTALREIKGKSTVDAETLKKAAAYDAIRSHLS